MRKNKKPLLIAVDGLDGAGKATQVALLETYLKEKYGEKVISIDFPDYNDQSVGCVKTFLNTANINTMAEIYAATYSYALNRYYTYINNWKKYYDEGYIIIFDRYVYSNIIYQGTRLLKLIKKFDINNEHGDLIKKFIRMVSEVEYNKLDLPKEDIRIFLSVNPYICIENLKSRKKLDKNENIDFQKDLYNGYIQLKEYINFKYFKEIDCNNHDKMRDVSDIFHDIQQYVDSVIAEMKR